MAEATKEELLFGRIALHNKIINQDQYKECLALRTRSTDPNMNFGAIVQAKGYVDDRQFRQIRKAQLKHIMKAGMSEADALALAEGRTPGAAEAPAPAPQPAAQPAAAPAPAPAPAPAAATDGDGLEIDVTRPGRDPKYLKTMAQLLKKARDIGSSDLHMSCGSKPFVRQHGEIVKFESVPVLTDEQNRRYLSSVLTDEDWEKFIRTNDWDGGVDLSRHNLGRYRTNILMQRRGVSGVFRVIKDKVPSLKSLGLPEDLEKFTTFHQGMVLVTGATGSGKSSTLAALIDIINQNRKDHVITLEDPIEYIYESKSCNITQRQIELHTKSWGNALRAALREDPDVIMIGEMRDLDTVRLAITAAETGHLVFGTLHTTNATRTIDRMLDVFPPKEQAQIRAMVSESLKGVISQQLVPRADGKGRVVAYELLFTTPAVSHLIRERRTFQLFSVMQTGKKAGMRLMDDTLRLLMNDKIITKETARACATNPRLFK